MSAFENLAFSLPLAAGGLLAVVLLRVVYSLYFHPLARYPGPLMARIGLLPWALPRFIKGDTASALIEVHRKWGLWVRIGYNELSTCDSLAVNVLYPTSTKVVCRERTATNLSDADFYSGSRLLFTARSRVRNRWGLNVRACQPNSLLPSTKDPAGPHNLVRATSEWALGKSSIHALLVDSFPPSILLSIRSCVEWVPVHSV